ncbi:growth arrest and DNA damage-inducible proteins-interacting protein 1-like [Anneissia japonica]|uniref:growth arrest and DNA damage-inducible proteins-interacting protein 1-like n=1 Tax=Anneissia japonica TaxID=1529436 RepID=UPI00142577FB|nr:growth arrest and DNA damage-inducible proteins-interacting protein 1-like [Anneissia japonica]
MLSCTRLKILFRTLYIEKLNYKYQNSTARLLTVSRARPIPHHHGVARPLTCSSVSMVPGGGIEEVDEFINTRSFIVSPKYRLNLIRKKYAKEGASSGVDPGLMWPSKEELEAQIAEEKEFEPSLQEMQNELLLEKQKRELEETKKAKIIETNMKKMPKLIAEYKKKEAEKLAQEEASKLKRQRLLEEAKEKMGYAIDPRNPRFQKMLADIEKEEKKKKKELKRQGIIVD